MRVARAALGPALLRWVGAEITGQDRVPGCGGVLLAANHRSFLDHFLLSAASPRAMRFLGKASLSRGPMGRLNMVMGMIPVDRGHADLAALEMVVARLRAGDVLGVFPEGTRSPTGELFRFRSGLARMAAAASVPVVPVGLTGTAEAWPVHHRAPRPRPAGATQVRFGELVPAPAGDARARRAFTAMVHERVEELCRQPLADRFAPVSDD